MKLINIINDGKLDIATGKSRHEANYRNKEWLWSQFLTKVSETHRTYETYQEYLNGKRDYQDNIKDVGGYVFGFLSGGKRKNSNVQHRSAITLDIDHVLSLSFEQLWKEIQMIYGNAACMYSTHKHSRETPRCRLIFPLDRSVAPDEYQAISRRIANNLGIEIFDTTTFQPERLMYWPSTSKDGEYKFEYQDGEWICADEILATYTNWRDSNSWPISAKVDNVVLNNIKKQGDPLEKPGTVGAWCRTYTIHDVIEKFLPDVYEPCDITDRYTYKEGSTSAGLIIYEDKFAYSHHGTDPVSMKLCNAFDLVRIHKFEDKDANIKDDTPMNKRPSFMAMQDFATNDPLTKKTIASELFNDFNEEQEQGTPEDKEWVQLLNFDRQGNLYKTLDNTVLILLNAPGLKGCIALDEFSQLERLLKPWPWQNDENKCNSINDMDISCLKYHLEKYWKLSVSKDTINDAIQVVLQNNKVHPLKEYLTSLSWDGKPRVDNLLIDYFGAENSAYVKAVTRKSLCAAVARVFEPGKKFDYMLILIGEQGKGKSTFFEKLGREWYSDSFNFHMLKNGKEAPEHIQGKWIIEVGELEGLNKTDLEAAKSFLSRLEDRFRPTYIRRVMSFPRVCAFYGTTNRQSFLRDPTGNRRFWPVNTFGRLATKNVFNDLTTLEVDQIWAEVMTYYRKKEKLYLPLSIEPIAQSIQQGHTEQDERRGVIIEFLERLLPDNWDDREIPQRRNYLQGDDELEPEGKHSRRQACAAEIWCELFKGERKDMSTHNTKFIHDIMQNLPGWEPAKSHRTFKIYGSQRTYIRKEESK